MIYIGIDPGQKGGFALITTVNGEIVNTRASPWDAEQFILSMREASADATIACLEKVNAMPGQGVTSMFSFGKSAGFIEGVLQSFAIPYQLVPPRTWKKLFALDNSKQRSIDVCQRLFPAVSLKRTQRCTTLSDGMAEALLMAEYARRKL